MAFRIADLISRHNIALPGITFGCNIAEFTAQEAYEESLAAKVEQLKEFIRGICTEDSHDRKE